MFIADGGALPARGSNFDGQAGHVELAKDARSTVVSLTG